LGFEFKNIGFVILFIRLFNLQFVENNPDKAEKNKQTITNKQNKNLNQIKIKI